MPPSRSRNPSPAVQEEEDVGAYGVFLDPELAERQKALAKEEERRAKSKEKKNLPSVTRKSQSHSRRGIVDVSPHGAMLLPTRTPLC